MIDNHIVLKNNNSQFSVENDNYINDILTKIHYDNNLILPNNNLYKIHYYCAHKNDIAYIGIVFYDNNINVFELFEKINIDSANKAEYIALIIALDISKQLNLKNIEIEGCNCLPIYHINGNWKVKNEIIKQYYDKAKSYFKIHSTFDLIKINLIEINQMIDLVNKTHKFKITSEVVKNKISELCLDNCSIITINNNLNEIKIKLNDISHTITYKMLLNLIKNQQHDSLNQSYCC